ncbi:hypothetical protein PoB_005995300 [Plakobranchus ocellatus]|uniref:Uncharacterized protein n=1 Tax=Plakobranchus ocellatus TaxID=259542 RepID=A0AAV4CNI3_9GAST|nr:hypothetical protein PoB_005995300 [Plakobranchus ocellatus]
MQGAVNGGRRRGGQKKRWDENIREWTGLELRNTLRKAEDREEWKAVVRRSSAASRRIPNLRGDSPQQGDFRLSGPPSGQGAGSGARIHDRKVSADLRADSLVTEPPRLLIHNDKSLLYFVKLAELGKSTTNLN